MCTSNVYNRGFAKNQNTENADLEYSMLKNQDLYARYAKTHSTQNKFCLVSIKT